MKHRWAKDYRLYRAFNLDSSSFSTTDIVASKRRRHVLSTLFSRQAISNMQGLVRDRITDMCDVLKRRDNAGKSSDLFFGFRGFTTDTITSFCFAKNFHATNAPEFEAPLIVALEQCLPSITLCKYFGSMLWVMNSIPEAIISKLSAPMAAVLLLKKTLLEQIKAVLRDPSVLENAPHPIIYHALLSPEINKGHALPSELGLLHEAQVLFSAGSDTVGTALMVAAFHLLHQPEQQRRLEEELRAAWPVLEEQPRFEALEKLPYLTAVVKETLRVSPGTPAGLPRVVPAAGAMLSGAFIPGGTIVSQSPLFVHNSEQIFPNAHVFDPERWMQPNSSQLETHLVAFSKGPRSCLGINLAYCELYLCLATVFRQFDVRLDTTKAAELSWTEHFLPHFHGEHLRAFCTPRSE